MDPIKPGFKTTEFWFTALAQIVGLLMASGAFADDSIIAKIVGLAAMALSTLGYQVSRGMAKKPAVNPVQPPSIPGV